MTFEQLYKEANELEWGQVASIIMRADQNASDTIHEEKSAPESEYGKIAMATLSDMLASNTYEPATYKWFAARGVKW